MNIKNPKLVLLGIILLIAALIMLNLSSPTVRERNGDSTPKATATVAMPVNEIKPTIETPTAKPGFEAVFAIAGLLAVAYLVLRQKNN